MSDSTASPAPRDAARHALFALTIFLGAFLLFQVQPLMGRILLPAFGGTASVWTTCLLFFQIALLAGYLYAHGSIRGLGPKGQQAVHLFLLGVALALLVFRTPGAAAIEAGEVPVPQILQILTSAIGLPFLVLAATSPLLQAWFHRVLPAHSPYRLYAVSNAGSLLGLLSYPIVIEPVFRLHQQVWLWEALFVLFAAGSIACGAISARFANGPREGAAAGAAEDSPPSLAHYAWWIALPALGAALLLGVTNQITQDIAPAPMLWIAPLGIYLITFIIVFDRERWYDRRIFGTLLLLAAPWSTQIVMERGGAALITQLGAHLLLLFACCMCLHGELVRLRPPPRYLTRFYLCVALGGALGGLFVAALAPLLFITPIEFHVSLAGACGLVFVRWVQTRDRMKIQLHRLWVWGPLAGFMTLLVIELFLLGLRNHVSAIAHRRNFYGSIAVYDRVLNLGGVRVLSHGRILHGGQLLRPTERASAITYYGPGSGPRLAIEKHPRRKAAPGAESLRIGVVGLGAGTTATFTRPGDRLDFYELNPQVEELARNYFTFLDEAQADVNVIYGDGRIMLERQLAAEPDLRYDVFIIDVFSGDAVPIHFLTREAMTLYSRCLAEDGLLVVNISNKYVNIEPAVRGMAEDAGLDVVCLYSPADPHRAIYLSVWCVLTRNAAFLEQQVVQDAVRNPDDDPPTPILWSDDFAALWPALRWRAK